MKRTPRVPKGIDLILEHFAELPDPRIDRTRRHPLINVIVMSLCGAICGADGWEALEMFAETREAFFRSFLDLAGGTPSADTFRRVLSALDPRAFEAAFGRWVQAFTGSLVGETVAVDGKTLRGALAHASEGGPFHMVHVWATSKHILLGLRAVAGAPGEVAAVIEMLQTLALNGAVVTADANSCTAAVTETCRAAGADYVLALKGNRGTLHRQVKQVFAQAESKGFRGVDRFASHDEAHGRIEHRIVRALPIDKVPLTSQAPWADLHSVIQVERTRVVKERMSVERFYYISSMAAKAEDFSRRIRGHWSIENQLHHCLDVSFDEDQRTIRDPIGAQNFALISRYALVLLKRETSRKMSVAMRRRRAAWEHEYLLQVLVAGTIAV
jgi:predicted transposase YbfD/YdcC